MIYNKENTAAIGKPILIVDANNLEWPNALEANSETGEMTVWEMDNRGRFVYDPVTRGFTEMSVKTAAPLYAKPLDPAQPPPGRFIIRGCTCEAQGTCPVCLEGDIFSKLSDLFGISKLMVQTIERWTDQTRMVRADGKVIKINPKGSWTGQPVVYEEIPVYKEEAGLFESLCLSFSFPYIPVGKLRVVYIKHERRFVFNGSHKTITLDEINNRLQGCLDGHG